MAIEWSRTQLTYLRDDTGFSERVMTDATVKNNWDRVMENAPGTLTNNQLYVAVKALMFEQVLNSSVRLHDYMIGVHNEKLSQVYNHLKERYEEYKPALEAIYGTRSQLRFITIRPTIRPEQEEPADADRYRRTSRGPWNSG